MERSVPACITLCFQSPSCHFQFVPEAAAPEAPLRSQPPPSPNPSTSTPPLTPLISALTLSLTISVVSQQSRALSLHLAVVLAPRRAARY